MLVPKRLLTPIKIRIFGPKTAKFGPKSAFLVILGQILPFLHILSNARPKNNVNKVPRWVFRYVGNKTFDFSFKKKDFLPKNDQIWPKTGIFSWYGPGHAGFFGALLVGQLVVVARGLYLARHLFTLWLTIITTTIILISIVCECTFTFHRSPQYQRWWRRRLEKIVKTWRAGRWIWTRDPPAPNI